MSSKVFNDGELAEIKAIKYQCKAKLRDLISDLPKELFPLLKGSILSGGAIASLMHGEEPNDWDMYLIDQDAGAEFQQRVLQNEWNIQDYIHEPTANYRTFLVKGRMVSEHATLFKNCLQIITYQGKAGRESFDFIHCMPYFDMASQKMFMSRAQYDAIKTKTLTKNPKHIADVLSWRLEKYISRGWKADNTCVNNEF
jgi:hypothetical protein